MGRRDSKDRREGEEAAKKGIFSKKQVEKRDNKRRQAQRRELFRIIYPPTQAPKVLNADFRVIEISKQGMKLASEKSGDDFSPPIKADSLVKLKLQFHDEETLEIQAKVLRCGTVPNSLRHVFICSLDKEIPDKRIGDEQRYLLKNFPDFCRALPT